MRHLMIALALALAAAGCTNDGQTSASNTAGPGGSPATSSSSSAPRIITADSSAAPTTSAATSDATSTTQKQTGPEPNMKRIYQLHDLKRTKVKVGDTTLDLWIMDTKGKRAEGMMYLTDKDVKNNEGMIFVEATESPQSFWMQNTILPLDIIYIGANKKVVNIVEGKPFDESPLPSTGPAMYTIELKKGMAKKFGIKPGLKLPISDHVRSQD